MNSQQFIEFREKSKLLISSSEWLVRQINDVMEEATALPDDSDISTREELASRMDSLLLRAEWEDRQHNRFTNQYKDTLDDE